MSNSATLSSSDLIFPSAHTSISTTLTSLKRANLSITNRLHSIKADANFVRKVAEAYQLPLIANERCGSWYIPPSLKKGSAYFKSTDGHFHSWSFSLRRLNLQVLDVVGELGGCIIVDSTRRGKSMPDALSKTVPIWIAVLNRLLFPDQQDSHDPQTPTQVISRSEHAQIDGLLSSFVANVSSLELDVDSLRAALRGKPMKPVWVTPNHSPIMVPTRGSVWNLVVLCTASNETSASQHTLAGYVQGAADDSEAWAHGLFPTLFWEHNNLLLSAAEDDLPEVIKMLISNCADESAVDRAITPIKSATGIWIGTNAAAEIAYTDFDVLVSCSRKPSELLARNLEGRYLHFACTTGKVGSRQLRAQLPKLQILKKLFFQKMRILVACPTGKDLSVGVALATICLFCKDDGSLCLSYCQPRLDKQIIRQRLSWITISMPEASPSRATLQSVNDFVLGHQWADQAAK